jgi:hypothetical protein
MIYFNNPLKMNNNTETNLKISKPKISNEMCLDITTPTSPMTNESLSPNMQIEKKFISILNELTEFDICGNYFKNVIVDEYEMKLRKNVKK